MSSIRLIPRTGRIELKQRTGSIKKAERQIITARDTEATYFDKNGILQTAAPHEIRYSKNFETGKQELLLEDESTNLCYGLSNWDILNSSEKIDDYTFQITGAIRSNQLLQVGDGKKYNRSVFLKNNGSDRIILSTQFNGGAANISFNFNSLEIKIIYGIFYNLNFKQYVNGWYRVSFTQKNETQNWGEARKRWFYIDAKGGTQSFFAKFPQCERLVMPSSPIITQGQPATRAADKLVFAT